MTEHKNEYVGDGELIALVNGVAKHKLDDFINAVSNSADIPLLWKQEYSLKSIVVKAGFRNLDDTMIETLKNQMILHEGILDLGDDEIQFIS